MLSLSNYSTVANLKELYAEKAKHDDIKSDNIRLFYMGKEIKDDDELHTYNI